MSAQKQQKNLEVFVWLLPRCKWTKLKDTHTWRLKPKKRKVRTGEIEKTREIYLQQQHSSRRRLWSAHPICVKKWTGVPDDDDDEVNRKTKKEQGPKVGKKSQSPTQREIEPFRPRIRETMNSQFQKHKFFFARKNCETLRRRRSILWTKSNPNKRSKLFFVIFIWVFSGKIKSMHSFGDYREIDRKN